MRLVCFGDSWTAGHGVEEEIEFKETVHPPTFIQRLREQNGWPRWVADKLNCTLINNGVCGDGNRYIYNSLNIAINSGFIKYDDIIIVMFSYPHRYVNTDNYLTDSFPIIFQEYEKLLKNYKHFYFNAFYPSFKDFDFNTDNIPDYFINPEGSVADILVKYELENKVSVWEYNSNSVHINDNDAFIEGGYHPNLLGYKLIADYMYNELVFHGINK